MKNKQLFRILCLAFALLMVLPFAACTKKPTTPSPTPDKSEKTPSVSRNEVTDDIGEVDMDGFELQLLNYTDAGHGYSNKTMTLEEDSADVVESAIFRRNAAIENRFNCFIYETQQDRPYDTLRTSAMSQTNDFDVSLLYEEHVNNVLISSPTGLSFYEDIPTLNLSKPYWNQDANEVYSIKGHQYAGVGDWCLSMYTKVYCYLLNKDYYDSLDPTEDIYDLVRNKQWTLEKMFEISNKYYADTDSEAGMSSGDNLGIVGTSKIHFQLLLTGSGLKFVEKDADGGYKLGILGNRASDIIDKILQLSKNGYYNNMPESANSGISAKEFVEGRVLLEAATITNLSGISQGMEERVGIIPAPLYDTNQAEYHSIAIGGLLTCFPANLKADRVNYTGMIVEAMCCASYNSVVPTYMNVVLKSQKADSEDDVDMITLLFDSISFDLGCSTWARPIRLALMENIFHPIETEYASLLAILADSIPTEIQKTLDKVDEIIDSRSAAQ